MITSFLNNGSSQQGLNWGVEGIAVLAPAESQKVDGVDQDVPSDGSLVLSGFLHGGHGWQMCGIGGRGNRRSVVSLWGLVRCAQWVREGVELVADGRKLERNKRSTLLWLTARLSKEAGTVWMHGQQ